METREPAYMMMKPHFESFSSSSSNASTWNRLSHMYIELSISSCHVGVSGSLRVDRLERLESEGQFLLFALLVQDGTDKDTETIVGHPVEELQLLLSRGDGRQDG